MPAASKAKKKTYDRAKSTHITLRLPDATVQRLLAIAEADGVSKAGLIFKVMDQYLRRRVAGATAQRG